MDQDLLFAVLASMLIGVAIGATAAHSLCGDQRPATPAAAPVALMRAA